MWIGHNPRAKTTPKNAIVYGSSVDIKYINFLQRNNSQTTAWNTAPKHPFTSLDEIKVQYKEIFEGIGNFQVNLTTSILTKTVTMSTSSCLPARCVQKAT